jgi:hypothetical protein
VHLVAHVYEKRESAPHIKAKEEVDGGSGCECVAASGPDRTFANCAAKGRSEPKVTDASAVANDLSALSKC